MNEKAQSEEFEEDDDDVVDEDATLVGGEDIDVDRLFRDFDKRKRGGPKPGDPAWRRLEKFREERHTAELVSDFDDYDIGGELGDDTDHHPKRAARR
ncbi:MAG TPA: hypothetical protein VET48_13875 [Steroidobacteraceae bacterium]|nr:hypothetical protein [Steroidobacteraceae bacterium]